MLLTDHQRENLTTLADFLEHDPRPQTERSFDMGWFHEKSDCPATIIDCKTSACAVGWAPTAGISMQPHDSWRDFGHRELCPYSSSWFWMFSANWQGTFNTAIDAAIRIRWILDGNEVVENDNNDNSLNWDWAIEKMTELKKEYINRIAKEIITENWSKDYPDKQKEGATT